MNSLIFGMLSFGIASAPLPSVEQAQQEVSQFETAIGLSGSIVRVREINKDHPSPFLAQAGQRSCTIYLNQTNDAQQVWSYIVSQSKLPSAVYQSFAIGHELTHCLMGKWENRKAARDNLEAQLGMKFKSRQHFEETLGDMVGLAYAKSLYPEHADQLVKAVKSVRQDFSSRDEEHNSAALLNSNNIAYARQLVSSAPITVSLNAPE